VIGTLLDLAAAFARIGLGAFGGGISTIPLIEHELVGKGWLSPEAFRQVLGLSQATPGPIAVNAATFVGFQRAGLAGAAAATAAVVGAPLCVLGLVLLLGSRIPPSISARIRRAIRPGVAALLTCALLPLLAPAASGLRWTGLFGACLMALRVRRLRENPHWLFLFGGAAGLLISLLG
jgi:chromate transporter